MIDRGKRGFTLLELMVAVAIVAILAALAYPSYLDSVRKSRRLDAQSTLLDIARQLERHYAADASYTEDLTELGYGEADWNQTPAGHYRVRVLAATAGCPISRCYLLEARARTGTSQAGDRIDAFRLWSTARKEEHLRSSDTWQDDWSGH